MNTPSMSSPPPQPKKSNKYSFLSLYTALLLACVSLVLMESNLPRNFALTPPAFSGCVMLAALPHRRLERESRGVVTGTEIPCPDSARADSAGFTLIELSIVLVIIGLIAGGVLVGQDLIRASQIRAQVSQIEKYNTAANSFYGKYGYLPGDIPAGPAALFGFAPRGSIAGEGDGNGLIEGVYGNYHGATLGVTEAAGETVMFWVDLSTVHFIDGTFFTASSTNIPASDVPLSGGGNYFPAAKAGSGNFIYVWSAALQGNAGSARAFSI